MDHVYNVQADILWRAMAIVELWILYAKPSTIQVETVFPAIVDTSYRIRLVLLVMEMQIRIVSLLLIKEAVCNATRDFIFLHRFVNRLISFAKQLTTPMALVWVAIRVTLCSKETVLSQTTTTSRLKILTALSSITLNAWSVRLDTIWPTLAAQWLILNAKILIKSKVNASLATKVTNWMKEYAWFRHRQSSHSARFWPQMENIVSSVWICTTRWHHRLAILFLSFAVLTIRTLEHVEVAETGTSFETVNAYILRWVLIKIVWTMMPQHTVLLVILATICSTTSAQKSIQIV